MASPQERTDVARGALLVGIAANQFLYIGGELKPDVRTPQILRIELE